MTTRTTTVAFVAAALLAGVSAQAENTAPRERFAVDFFLEACVQHAYNAQARQQWIAAKRIPRMQRDYEENVLAGQPGQAWQVGNPHGGFILTTHSDGPCTLFAQHADSASLRSYFDSVITQVIPAGWSVTREHKQKELTPGLLETTHIDAASPESGNILRIVISTSSSTQGGYQAALSSVFMVAPNK